LVLFSSAYFLIRQQLYILSQKISAQDLKVAHIPQLLARTVANFSKAYSREGFVVLRLLRARVTAPASVRAVKELIEWSLLED
jgi:hypothetical protein